MAKHTEGPWQWLGNAYTAGYGRPKPYLITDGGSTTIASVTQENVFDAHLISAAPELLEALERLFEDDSADICVTTECIEIAKAAIAKAKGK